MAKFVPDLQTERWVVIAPKRAFRPSQSHEDEGKLETTTKNGYNFRSDCPFCLGNEAMTPPEISRVQKQNGIKPTDWLIRVVPNKFPITDIHEVIIHSPDHKLDIPEMEQSHLTSLLKVYRERYNALSVNGSVLIFNNKGFLSGESLIHPHSQVVVVPSKVKLDVLSREPVRNVVLENDFFVVYCPDFSQWPYEVWIAHNQNEVFFGEINDEEIGHLALILQNVIRNLLNKFPDISYNFYIYPYKGWYLRIIPRLTNRAGFELGTGLNVNVVDPAIAAEELREK